MTKQDLTHLYLIVDRSGSISSCLADMEGGLNTFIDEMRKQPGQLKVTLVQFDGGFEELFWDRPISEVGRVEIHPRGSTALLDAVGNMIATAGERLAAMSEDERPGSVIVCIETDGEENASREYNYESVKKLIRQQEEQYQWLFQYIGANQDAYQVGTRMGVSSAHTMSFDTAHTQDAYTAMATNTSKYLRGVQSGLSHEDAKKSAEFTDEDKAKAKS